MSSLSDRLLALGQRERDFPTMLLWAIVGFTSIALAWAALARLDVVVNASGRLIPSAQLQTVTHLEGGTLARILVRPGQKVAAGQVLIRLDPVQRAADAAAARASLDALSARAARLAQETGGAAPSATPSVSDPDLLASETVLARAERAALATQRAMAQARVEQAMRAEAEAQALLGQRREALNLALREETVLKPLVAQGAEPALSLERATSQRLQAEAAARAAGEAVARAGAAVAEAQRGVTAVDRQFRSRAAEALATTRAELAARAGAQPGVADRLARTDVRAPMAGIISRLRITTPGSAITPGQPLLEMVPVGDTLLVEAQVSPADIGFVRPGQPARVRISAYDYGIYGAMDGTVQNVAPDAVIDERTGAVHFLVRIVLARACFPTAEAGCLPLGPGMLADVSLLGPQRSVLDYLLSPITRIRDSAFREP